MGKGGASGADPGFFLGGWGRGVHPLHSPPGSVPGWEQLLITQFGEIYLILLTLLLIEGLSVLSCCSDGCL